MRVAIATFTKNRWVQEKLLFPKLGSRPVGVREEMTGHGFRSTASTLLNEQGWHHDAIERQLAHTERSGVRAAYNYAEHLPLRRQMMQAWADYLDKLREAEPEETRSIRVSNLSSSATRTNWTMADASNDVAG